MHEVELIFIREDLFTDEPDRKVVIGRFKEPPASGDYLFVEADVSVNEWAYK